MQYLYLYPMFAFLLTAMLIVLLRPLAVNVGLVDVPNARKSHTGQIPLIGGVAIFLSVAFTLLIHTRIIPPSAYGMQQIITYFAAATVIILIGIWDDRKDLSAYYRFGAQIVAALIMCFGADVILYDLGRIGFSGEPVILPKFIAIPFTVFAVLGIINAVNMCDGLDGLSGSLSLVSLLGFGIATVMWGGYNPFINVMAAAVAGFLLFNMRTVWRQKAWVFLGDAGSMLLGLTLSWLAISMSQGDIRVITPPAALWFLMVPIFDAVSMMTRRILHGRSPFQADKEHLHHIFLLAGFSVGETVAIMAGFAVAGVVVGLGGMYLGISDFWMAAAFTVCGLLYFWMIMRAWRVMTFLRRSICRRAPSSHPDFRHSERRQNSDPDYAGPERRCGEDRRHARYEYRREGEPPVNPHADQEPEKTPS